MADYEPVRVRRLDLDGLRELVFAPYRGHAFRGHGVTTYPLVPKVQDPPGDDERIPEVQRHRREVLPGPGHRGPGDGKPQDIPRAVQRSGSARAGSGVHHRRSPEGGHARHDVRGQEQREMDGQQVDGGRLPGPALRRSHEAPGLEYGHQRGPALRSDERTQAHRRRERVLLPMGSGHGPRQEDGARP